MKRSNMLRWVISCLALVAALGVAPALADPTPPPSEAPSAAASAAPEASPAPAESAVPAASAAPGASAAPSVDQAVTVRAMDWLHRLQTGDLDRTQLTLQFNAVLTPERVKGIVEQLRPLGKVKSYAYVGQAISHGVRAYQFSVEFAAAKYLYLFEVDDKDEVAGILLTPPK